MTSLFSWLLPTVVLALSVNVTPSDWTYTAQVGDTVTRDFSIINTDETPLRYRMWTEETEGLVSFIPNEWRLNPGEQQSVTVRTQFNDAGIYTFDISVLAQSVSTADVNVGAGIKVPVAATIETPELSRDSWYIIMMISIGFVFLLILWVIIKFIRL